MSEKPQQPATRSQTKASPGAGVIDPTPPKPAPSRSRPKLAPAGSKAGTSKRTRDQTPTEAGTERTGSDSLVVPAVAVPKKASSVASTSPAKSTVAASVFARRTPEDAIIKTIDCPELWLWERLTIQIARIPFNPSLLSDLQKQINEMIEEYSEIVAMAFPKEWMTLDNMPKSDQLTAEFRAELHKELVDYAEKHPGVLRKDNKLESALQSFENQPSMLYNALKDVQYYHQQQKSGKDIPEAETRRVWDNLIHAYGSSLDEKQLLAYYEEKTLHCPKNDFLKDPTSYPMNWLAQLQETLTHLQLAVIDSDRIKVPKDVESVMRKAYRRAQGVNNFFKRDPPPKISESRLEPLIGRADGILAFTVPPVNPLPTTVTSTSPKLKRRGNISLKDTIVQGLYKADTHDPDNKPQQESNSAGSSPPVDKKNSVGDSTTSTSTSQSDTPHMTCLMCPVVTEHLGGIVSVCDRVNAKSKKTSTRGTALLCIPLSFTEYKKDDAAIQQAFNQCKLYSIAGAKFLAALGIHDFPIYGIVAGGLRGTILMTWHSRKSTDVKNENESSGYNVIMDTYLVSFDLTKPIEMYRFMLAVHRIHARCLTLLEKIRELNLEDVLMKDGFGDWMHKKDPEQIPEVKVNDVPVDTGHDF